MFVISIGLAACGTGPDSTPAVPSHTPSVTPDELATLIAMQAIATDVPTAAPEPSATATTPPTVPTVAPPTALPTQQPTATGVPASAVPATAAPTSSPAALPPYPTNTPRATQGPVLLSPAAAVVFDGSQELADHYWFARPFPRDPAGIIQDYFSRSYAYGSTGGGQFKIHHGVDTQNPSGTPILAVSDGWVVYAGSDSKQQFGPQLDFYGNLVILEHDLVAPTGEPLYTLYGHMSQVDVTSGQRVKLGDKIGEVGATGVALGAHLHFEVRLNDPYDYGSTVNPDLWLRSWMGFGVLAGRVFDRDGSRIYGATITLSADEGPTRYATSYEDNSVNPDPFYGEHYTRGDLPEGRYDVYVRIQDVLRFQGEVTIIAGQTNWLDITLK
ncbi:MAG: peptidoglycan DD-metalloendopeptidase family protein [Anaerolineae bacterium]|nr:peptidoglycan DD-metalloendopeptidase family protein [Anaerolineae bacterium]